MSHQSGIRVDEEISRLFRDIRDPATRTRLVKLSIKDERLHVDGVWPAASSWQEDYKNLMPKVIQPESTAYILFRLDSKNTYGNQFLFICYSPDVAKVKDKMLLAATRATLKTDFGLHYIKEEYNASSYDEVLWSGYERHQKTMSAPAPLSDLEEQLQSVKVKEFSSVIQRHHHSEHHVLQPVAQTGASVLFPVDSAAQEKLKMLADGLFNYVQVGVDVLNEAIKLEAFDTVTSIEALASLVPKGRPAYHFYRYDHKSPVDGSLRKPLMFFYSMPSQNCTIKEKMLYSSCRAPFLATCSSQFGLVPEKKMEIDGADEITREFFMSHLYPPEHNVNMPVSRPSGPRGRGPRRLINRPAI